MALIRETGLDLYGQFGTAYYTKVDNIKEEQESQISSIVLYSPVHYCLPNTH